MACQCLTRMTNFRSPSRRLISKQATCKIRNTSQAGGDGARVTRREVLIKRGDTAIHRGDTTRLSLCRTNLRSPSGISYERVRFQVAPTRERAARFEDRGTII